MASAVEERAIRSVGRRIAELREVRGLTQAELAERLEIALKNEQRIEHGRMNLTIRSLVRIARALECSVARLFDPPKRMNPAPPGRPVVRPRTRGPALVPGRKRQTRTIGKPHGPKKKPGRGRPR